MILFKCQDGTWLNMSRFYAGGVGDKENRDSGYPVQLSLDGGDGPRPAVAAILKTREGAEKYFDALMEALAEGTYPTIRHEEIIENCGVQEVKP